jgi:hypothetical protein
MSIAPPCVALVVNAEVQEQLLDKFLAEVKVRFFWKFVLEHFFNC